MSRRHERRSPLVLTDPEPQIRNDHAATPLPNILRGTSFFEDLVGANNGLPILTEQAALAVSAIYACVSLIAGVIAALPVQIYARANDGELDRLASDDLWWVLNEQMVPRWSAANGWEFIAQSKLLRGDGLARIRRNVNGGLIGIEPLHHERVTPVPTPDGMRLIYVVQPDPTIPNPLSKASEVLDQDDVLHFAGFGFNGVRGLSPLRYFLRDAGAVATAAQEYSARFFANGARPDYAVMTDKDMGPDKVDQLLDRLDEKHRSPAKAHRPIVLTNGLKAEALSLDAEDMQLIATRQFQIEEIARIYGIPPFMIGHNEKTTSWGSGVEAMGTAFVRYALRRHLNKFENELNRKLFRTAGKVLAFDTDELERADFKSLIESFRSGLGRAGEQPIMTVEEVRERLRLPRTPKNGTLTQGTGNAPTPAA
jgi:HK97 family phage portal protein